jgi:hypothetical protein
VILAKQELLESHCPILINQPIMDSAMVLEPH